MNDDSSLILGPQPLSKQTADGAPPQLVLGFSCTGKSSFIRHLMECDPRYQNARQLFLKDFRQPTPQKVRPADLLHVDLGVNYYSGRRMNRKVTVKRNPYLQKIIRSGDFSEAVLMIASEEELLKRIAERKMIGIDYRRDTDPSPYVGHLKRAQLRFHPLVSYYQIWLKELRAAGVSYRFVYTCDDGFHEIDDEAEALALLSRGSRRRIPKRLARKIYWGFRWWLTDRVGNKKQ